jgi:hypothetical protein
MSSLSLNERERQRLASIASEYESQGYNVKLEPAPADLPDFLTDLKPDLIAIGKGESVVVQVKTRDELKDDQPFLLFEQAIRNRPGWRFELVIDRLTNEEEREPIGAAQIRASLDEGNELQKGGYLTAALLVLWSATEGVLRLLANRENIELESPAAGYILKRLYTLGLLAREQYLTLDEMMKLRNQAAHGFQVSVAPQDPKRIAAVLSELLSEVETKAA